MTFNTACRAVPTPLFLIVLLAACSPGPAKNPAPTEAPTPPTAETQVAAWWEQGVAHPAPVADLVGLVGEPSLTASDVVVVTDPAVVETWKGRLQRQPWLDVDVVSAIQVLQVNAGSPEAVSYLFVERKPDSQWVYWMKHPEARNSDPDITEDAGFWDDLVRRSLADTTDLSGRVRDLNTLAHAKASDPERVRYDVLSVERITDPAHMNNLADIYHRSPGLRSVELFQAYLVTVKQAYDPPRVSDHPDSPGDGETSFIEVFVKSKTGTWVLDGDYI